MIFVSELKFKRLQKKNPEVKKETVLRRAYYKG